MQDVPLVSGARCATLNTMGIKKQLYNSAATAICILVWISTPLMAQTNAVSDRLDLLFEQLLEAEPEDVGRLERQIINEWGKSGSAALDVLLRRGKDAADEEAYDVAVEHYTALIDHAPTYAEGYHGRATAYYNLGLYGPAIDDLRQALLLEPRHFGAMVGVAVVLEEFEKPRDALEVWMLVAALKPADAEITAVVERLTTQLSGEAL